MQYLKSLKRLPSALILTAFFILGNSAFLACSRKTGCPANEAVHTQRDKNGKPKKGPTTHLFPKEMRRKN